MNKYIPSTTGYSCPNCGAYCSHETLTKRGDMKSVEFPVPHNEWVEYHKCSKCETKYSVINSNY